MRRKHIVKDAGSHGLPSTSFPTLLQQKSDFCIRSLPVVVDSVKFSVSLSLPL